MASNSTTTHEPVDALHPETLDLHRALVSLMEELEAVDWYQQRIDATSDEALKRILAHNRDEEIEHASMVLEWIRRRNPTFDRNLRTYLFTSGEITAIEVEETANSDPVPGEEKSGQSSKCLTVGSLMK